MLRVLDYEQATMAVTTVDGVEVTMSYLLVVILGSYTNNVREEKQRGIETSIHGRMRHR
jgi:hypothetical protein